MKTVVSIIIPIYNIQPYLNKCIDSVLEQSLREIEIILVDDGSTDGSSEVCDAYARKDERIRVIHKKNEGLSCARNDGIAASSAPYIMFVDGDDVVDRRFAEAPYRMAVALEADLVLYEHDHYPPTEKARVRRFQSPSGLLSKDDAFRYNLLCAAAWLGLYRRELFDDILFPPGKYYEDVGATYRLVHKAKRVAYLDEAIYHYRTSRPGSITTDAGTRDHPDRKEMQLLRMRDLCRWGYGSLLGETVFSFAICYGCKDLEERYIRLLKDFCREPVSGLSRKRRIMRCAYLISPAFFDAVCILSGKRLRTPRGTDK